MARFLVLNCVDATCLRAPWASGTETNDVDSIRPRGSIGDEARQLVESQRPPLVQAVRLPVQPASFGSRTNVSEIRDSSPDNRR